VFRISKLTLLIAFAVTLCAPLACASSTRLDRGKAAEMIRNSSQFTQPYEIIIRHGSDRRYLNPVSPDETRAQGEARAVPDFCDSSPYRGVLCELGLINVKARYVSTRMYGDREDKSTYDLDIKLTPAGEQLWRDLNLAVDSSSLPLARRELVQVTGITGGDERSRRATVELNWKWVPTLAGRAMPRGTPEFSRLPERIRQQFDDKGITVFSIGSHPPLDLGGTRRATAQFQLYDDGWRLMDIRPIDTRPLNPID
jgi:hypothetical protein